VYFDTIYFVYLSCFGEIIHKEARLTEGTLHTGEEKQIVQSGFCLKGNGQ